MMLVVLALILGFLTHVFAFIYLFLNWHGDLRSGWDCSCVNVLHLRVRVRVRVCLRSPYMASTEEPGEIQLPASGSRAELEALHNTTSEEPQPSGE